MAADRAGRLGLGPIDQIAYVVRDLEAALPSYEAVYGPFRLGDSPLRDCTIRGKTADCHLKLAVNDSGPVEIELIEVLSGDTPHSEHLREHGEGLHHVRFRVSDLDARLEALAGEGYQTIFYKKFAPNLGFAYVELPESLGASVIELLQIG